MTLPFREQARDELRKAFGEPEVIKVIGGEIYRWILKRNHGLNLYVTLDSPEIPQIAHIMVSDPSSKAIEPINSLTLRTLEEVKRTAEQIKKQWHDPESTCR